MAYQFGTKRLQSGGVATNPLQELLKMEEARRAKEDNSAMRTLKQFPFKDVYQDANGKYYENRTDNQGNFIQAEISKGTYDAYKQQNVINNQARSNMGLNPVQTTPKPSPEEKSGGFIEGVKKFGKM